MTQAISEIITFPKVKRPIRLDLGCGNNKQEGFFGVDITKGNTQADIEHDLRVFPWPFETGSIDEMFSSHHFEHINQFSRGKFMDEAYRCLKTDGHFKIITPYCWSRRSVQDFTHMWPPIVPESYLYFNQEWRKINGLEHWEYDLKCNFEIKSCQFVLSEKWRNKPEQEMLEGVEHNINVAEDMVVILRKL